MEPVDKHRLWGKASKRRKDSTSRTSYALDVGETVSRGKSWEDPGCDCLSMAPGEQKKFVRKSERSMDRQNVKVGKAPRWASAMRSGWDRHSKLTSLPTALRGGKCYKVWREAPPKEKKKKKKLVCVASAVERVEQSKLTMPTRVALTAKRGGARNEDRRNVEVSNIRARWWTGGDEEDGEWGVE